MELKWPRIVAGFPNFGNFLRNRRIFCAEDLGNHQRRGYTRRMDFDINSQLRRQVVAQLTQRGITPTRQRVDIGMRLLDRDRHVTADQLLEEVNRSSGDVSRATIYNTLGLFARKGLVREVVVEAGKHVYDTNTAAHHHLYNVDTGELQDIDSEQLRVSGLPDLGAGLCFDGVDIVVRVRNKIG